MHRTDPAGKRQGSSDASFSFDPERGDRMPIEIANIAMEASCFLFLMTMFLALLYKRERTRPLRLIMLIFIVCVILAKKKAYPVDGRMYPVFLILFGGTRFFLEFLRLNVKVFWGISVLALWALLMVVVGIVWLVREKKKDPETAEETKTEE